MFTLPDQVRIAKLLGYADVSRLRAVEHFMKRHYGMVLHVHQMGRRLGADFAPSGNRVELYQLAGVVEGDSAHELAIPEREQ